MAGIELATAYVSIVASAKGIRKDVASELRGVEADAGRSGRTAGAGLAAGLAGSMGGASGRLRGEGSKAGEGFKAGLMGAMRNAGDAAKGVIGAALAGGAVVAAAGLAAIVGKSVDAASEMQQSQGAVAAIFKGNAGEIEAAASRAAQNVGVSANEYRGLASVLGAQLKNKGIDDFAGQTQNLIGLGADLSAQFGGTTKEAVEALTSALRGETDPIERYGVSLNAAAVEAEALRMNTGKTKATLTDQEKAMASLALITKQSADAQGTFTRESDTLAGQQQRLKASVDDLSARFGTALLPIFSQVASVLNTQVVPAVNGFITEFQKGEGTGGAFRAALEQTVAAFGSAVAFFQANSAWLTPLLVGIGAAVVVLGVLAGVFAVASAAAAAWGMAMAVVTSPITAVVLAIGLLIAAGIAIYKNWDTIKAKAGEVWGAVKAKVVESWNAVKAKTAEVWDGVKAKISGAVNAVKSAVSGAWNAVRSATVSAWERVKSAVTSAWERIKGAVTGAVERVKIVVAAAWERVKGATTSAWDRVRAAVASAFVRIVSAVNAGLNRARSFVSSIMAGIAGIWSRAWSGLVSVVSGIAGRVAGAARGVMSAVQGVFGGAGSWLMDAGRRIVSGLIDGLVSMFGSVRSTLGGLTSMIPNWKGPRERDSVLLRDAGQLIIGGLVGGFRDRFGDVRSTLGDLTDEIEGGVTPSSAALVSPRTSGTSYRPASVGASAAAASGPAVNITVNNPVAEPTSRTTNRALGTLALLGQIGGGL